MGEDNYMNGSAPICIQRRSTMGRHRGEGGEGGQHLLPPEPELSEEELPESSEKSEESIELSVDEYIILCVNQH